MSSTILICRCCMLELELPEGVNMLTCPACGTRCTCPPAEEDVLAVLRRATRQRLDLDFTRAETSYQFVLQELPDSHEALWGLVECRYGIEYVEDRASGRRLPVVHTVRTRPMSTDPDFRHACELAPEEVRRQYEAGAEYIDLAMARIRDLAENGNAYDVFLCHKTSGTEKGSYTEDYNRAVQLYMKLDKAGYRVFIAPFSGLTPGESYEAGIYHALRTARVMLLVASDPDNLNSAWVRSEWQRYLEMLDDGADKHLIPLMYAPLDPSRLPLDIRARHLQAIRMEDLDATEMLMSTLRKYLGEPAPARPGPIRPQSDPQPQPEPAKPAPRPEAVQPGQNSPAPEKAKPVPAKPAPAPQKPAQPKPASEKPKPAPAQPKPASKPAKPTPVPQPQPPKKSAENPILYRFPLPTAPAPTQSAADAGKSCTPEKHFQISPPDANGNVTITGYRSMGSDGVMVVPPRIDGHPVTGVGENAFKSSSLVSITLPEGLEHIGDCAFAHCSQLSHISLPESLKMIGSGAFMNCERLKSIRIPEGVTILRSNTFWLCPLLSEVILPESLSEIHRGALSTGRSLTTLQIPAGTVRIDPTSFQFTPQLKALTVAKGNTAYYIHNGALCGYDGTLVCYPAASPATHFDIPDGIRKIDSCAFDNCRNLKSVTIPRTVREIGWGAFSDCPNLKLPLSVKLRFIGSKIFG